MSAQETNDLAAVIASLCELAREIGSRAIDSLEGATEGQLRRVLEELPSRIEARAARFEAEAAKGQSLKDWVVISVGEALVEQGLGPSEDDISEAIEGCKPFVVRTLRNHGALAGWARPEGMVVAMDHPAVGDAMGEIAVHVMKSLPTFMLKSRVSLTAWAMGVAKNILNDAYRTRSRRGAKEEPFEDALVRGSLAEQQESFETSVLDRMTPRDSLLEELITAEAEGTTTDEHRLALIAAARDRITDPARDPDGVAKWNRIVRMAGMPVRGRAAREQLREEMSTITGQPPRVYGSEPEAEPLAPAVVAARPGKDAKFIAHCSRCGDLSTDLPTNEVLAILREHQLEHSKETRNA